ncbi:hypothetical protein KQI65_11025 [bacterium]|nr:hypothetical protein [bacterium]
MDKQDFEVTVRETWEGIEKAIDQLALDGVETYPENGGMQLMFDDGSFITLHRDDELMQINLLRGEYRMPFYWDTVEEHWYARADERHLLTVLNEVLTEKLSQNVVLPDLV